MPSTNSLRSPSFSRVRVISGRAAVDHDGLQPHPLEQGDVLRERLLEAVLHHRRAAVLDDGDLAGEGGDVLERLGEERLLEGRGVVGDPVVLRHPAVGLLVDERGVVGVDLHVVVGEVAAPGGRPGVALRRARRGRRSRVSRIRARSASRSTSAGAPRAKTVTPWSTTRAANGSTGQLCAPGPGAHGGEDPAPVRIGAEDRRLDERRAGDGGRAVPGDDVGGGAGDHHLHHASSRPRRPPPWRGPSRRRDR